MSQPWNLYYSQTADQQEMGIFLTLSDIRKICLGWKSKTSFQTQGANSAADKHQECFKNSKSFRIVSMTAHDPGSGFQFCSTVLLPGQFSQCHSSCFLYSVTCVHLVPLSYSLSVFVQPVPPHCAVIFISPCYLSIPSPLAVRSLFVLCNIQPL